MGRLREEWDWSGGGREILFCHVTYEMCLYQLVRCMNLELREERAEEVHWGITGVTQGWRTG